MFVYGVFVNYGDGDHLTKLFENESDAISYRDERNKEFDGYSVEKLEVE